MPMGIARVCDPVHGWGSLALLPMVQSAGGPGHELEILQDPECVCAWP